MDELPKVVEAVAGVLGPAVIGTYLHGSSVAGGLKPASDVDVLVVVRRTMSQPERESLLGGLLAVSGARNNARPVELTVVVQPEIRPWRYPPVADFLYGEWLRAAYEAGRIPRPETMPDLALLIATALAGDRPLTGPRPAQVLDPVPHTDVIRAAVAGIPDLLNDLEGDTRNVLLTFARIWCTLATGEIRSKDAAATWALARLPPEHRPALDHARDLYLHRTYSDESWSDELLAHVRPCVDRVLVAIDRLHPAAPEVDVPAPGDSADTARG